MLSDKFSRKDADFAILLSTYLLNEDYSTIKDKMARLAELGHIEAIQYYYLLKSKNEINEKIDLKLESMLGQDDFEILMALRNYLRDKKVEAVTQNKNNQESKLDEIEKTCFKKLKSLMEENQDEYLFIRYIELKKMLGKKLTQIDKQNLKKVQSNLLKEYKENSKNIKIAYTLGKILVLFNEDESLKILGKQILSEISKKKFSKQLEQTTLILDGSINLPKEQIKKKSVKTQSRKKVEDRQKE